MKEDSKAAIEALRFGFELYVNTIRALTFDNELSDERAEPDPLQEVKTPESKSQEPVDLEHVTGELRKMLSTYPLHCAADFHDRKKAENTLLWKIPENLIW